MTHPWDEYSKSLAEPVPRRESLRRLGVVLAGAVLGPLGTAWATPTGKPRKGKDPCQTFCKCRDKRQQDACMAACRACGGDTRRLCGACGSYYCADFAGDVSNCGACGYVCAPPGPYESGACISGTCVYPCVEGAVVCDGTCAMLDHDPNNCGACGNVCPQSAKDCVQGVCMDLCGFGAAWCGSGCVNILSDNANCGSCGVECAADEICTFGVCQGTCSGC